MEKEIDIKIQWIYMKIRFIPNNSFSLDNIHFNEFSGNSLDTLNVKLLLSDKSWNHRISVKHFGTNLPDNLMK